MSLRKEPWEHRLSEDELGLFPNDLIGGVMLRHKPCVDPETGLGGEFRPGIKKEDLNGEDPIMLHIHCMDCKQPLLTDESGCANLAAEMLMRDGKGKQIRRRNILSIWAKRRKALAKKRKEEKRTSKEAAKR